MHVNGIIKVCVVEQKPKKNTMMMLSAFMFKIPLFVALGLAFSFLSSSQSSYPTTITEPRNNNNNDHGVIGNDVNFTSSTLNHTSGSDAQNNHAWDKDINDFFEYAKSNHQDDDIVQLTMIVDVTVTQPKYNSTVTIRGTLGVTVITARKDGNSYQVPKPVPSVLPPTQQYDEHVGHSVFYSLGAWILAIALKLAIVHFLVKLAGFMLDLYYARYANTNHEDIPQHEEPDGASVMITQLILIGAAYWYRLLWSVKRRVKSWLE